MQYNCTFTFVVIFTCPRHVILPKNLAELVPRTHLMTESEWRNLGVQQSPGWMHYLIHEPGKIFSNSFISLTKEIMTLTVFCDFISLPSLSLSLSFDWEDEFIKNTLTNCYVSYFQLSSRCFEMWSNSLCCWMYYFKVNKELRKLKIVENPLLCQ